MQIITVPSSGKAYIAQHIIKSRIPYTSALYLQHVKCKVQICVPSSGKVYIAKHIIKSKIPWTSASYLQHVKCKVQICVPGLSVCLQFSLHPLVLSLRPLVPMPLLLPLCVYVCRHVPLLLPLCVYVCRHVHLRREVGFWTVIMAPTVIAPYSTVKIKVGQNHSVRPYKTVPPYSMILTVIWPFSSNFEPK